jgi:hypothetical protein
LCNERGHAPVVASLGPALPTLIAARSYRKGSGTLDAVALLV